MRVLAINGSPRMGKGNTALILDPFLEGMEEVGADVELFFTKELDIHPCQGEFGCWIDTPGQCFRKDDMQGLYPRMKIADIWVLATPLFLDGVSGPVKNLLDRLLPLSEPFVTLRNGRTRHVETSGKTKGQLVLVSSCGLWELENFEPLLSHVRAVCENLALKFSGALLRPHAPAMMEMIGRGVDVSSVGIAAKEAGRQLARGGAMEKDTLLAVSRPLMSAESYVQGMNNWFLNARRTVSRTRKEPEGSCD